MNTTVKEYAIAIGLIVGSITIIAIAIRLGWDAPTFDGRKGRAWFA